ncbi:LacI family DNA-binding transcriptional regulator [Microbacterium hydrocarbonoxydans]|uniref:LacI family DNA-binding transcriptional regulator n=1 Tax=Microbacterium hydrocarbonoxydans TaxID=273678 RepID=UPI00203B8643|nr:LacI family DNA-binding transcriptional regulator [Microbacterium hydrocarbonoxydans]MCM3780767.1 LacI family transcriptional regulator [Microbacterium hydrocarbonoxydans]
MATLRDVAELASVSVATASRVLNGSASNHPVSESVQQAVRAAAATLGYTASATARALQQKRSRIIGVIASDILDPYFAEMTRGIEVEATSRGYVTVLANANRDPLQELARFRALREHQASGIVFCGSDIEGSPGTGQLAKEVNAAVQQGTSVVALAPRGFAATSIVVDNAAAAAELTSYLLGLGHRDIAFIGGIPGLTASEQRLIGYRKTMFDAGLAPRVADPTGMSQAAGSQSIEALIGSDRMPDAVICSNDEVAIGALAGLWRAGLRAPDDVSVAGIGGTAGGEVFDLTTMTLPLVELGTLAARFIAAPEPVAAPATAPPVSLRVGTTTARRR